MQDDSLEIKSLGSGQPLKKGSFVVAKNNNKIDAPSTKSGKVVLPKKELVLEQKKEEVKISKNYHRFIPMLLVGSFCMVISIFIPREIKKIVLDKQSVITEEDYLSSIENDLVSDDSLQLHKFLKQQLEYAKNLKVKSDEKLESQIRTQRKTIVKSSDILKEDVQNIILKITKRRFDVQNLASSIVDEALKQNYDPIFTAAVIRSESAFNEMAKSWVGARGLMQIMPQTGSYLAKRFNVNHTTSMLHERDYNLKLGVSYLKELEDKYAGNRMLTLIAYNWGPAKLDRAIKNGRGVPAECIRYALKIMQDHNLWQNGYIGKPANG